MTVETSIVILPFLFITLMTLEVVLITFFQAIFNKAVYETGRTIRTGNVTSLTSVQAYICNDAGKWSLVPLPSCTARTAVILNTITSGVPTQSEYSTGINSGVLVTSALESNGSPTSTFPGACSLVVMQAFYQWPILIILNRPFLNSGFNTPSFLFATASVFQNESAQTGGQCSGPYS